MRDSWTLAGDDEGVGIFVYHPNEQRTHVPASRLTGEENASQEGLHYTLDDPYKDVTIDCVPSTQSSCTDAIKVESVEETSDSNMQIPKGQLGGNNRDGLASAASSNFTPRSDPVSYDVFRRQLEAEAAAASQIEFVSEFSSLLPLFAHTSLNNERYHSGSSATLSAEATPPPSDSSSLGFGAYYYNGSNSSSRSSSSGSTALSSPCLRRDPATAHRSTGTRNSHFKPQRKGHSVFSTIQKPSWLKTKASTSHLPRKKSENALSLEQLRNIEKNPRNKWTSAQRQFLCVLNRWFQRVPSTFAAIFNSVFNLSLPTSSIDQQFGSYIRLHGGRAFISYKDVFEITPFHDPEGKYTFIRDLIETEAAALGVDIRRADQEAVSPSGRAEKARSDLTRRRYKDLVRTASQQRLVASAMEPTLSPRRIYSLGGHAMAEESNPNDIDYFVDMEESTQSPTSSTDIMVGTATDTDSPHLAYRVWDKSSRTMFKNDVGFVAGLFAHRRSPVTRPIPASDEYGIFDVLANSHLSKRSCNASAFVSTCSSLLQIINYSSAMIDPRLAVIDLEHPDLKEPHRKHSASKIIADLQSKGEMWWTRYKGDMETMIWGSIPKSAIIHDLKLSELETLAAQSKDINCLLSLEIFTGESKTRIIAQQLKTKNYTLNVQTTRSMSQIARLFGLGGVDVRATHIREFCSNLVDGWSIQDAPLGDATAMGDLAMRFALALGHRSSSMLLQDVMGAFIDGVKMGTKNMEFYSSPRRRGVLL